MPPATPLANIKRRSASKARTVWSSSVRRSGNTAKTTRRRRDGSLPTPAEALGQPFRDFPSWFMRITCARCGKDRMFSETHAAQSGMRIRDILAKMRHDGCGGRPGRVELLTGIEGVSSRPVRKIVVLAER
jgi:hypothetical protein